MNEERLPMTEIPTRERVSDCLFCIYQMGVKGSYAQTQGRTDEGIRCSGKATGLILEALAAFDALVERNAKLEARIADIGLDLKELANDLFNGDINARGTGRELLKIDAGERYMTTRPDRNPERVVALFWLSLSACACLGTMYVTKLLGADWRLYTALGLGAGLAMLIVGGMCCTAGDAR